MAPYDYDTEAMQEFPVLGLVSLWFGVVLVGITAVAEIIPGSVSLLAESLRFVLFALLLASGVYLAVRLGEGHWALATTPLLINGGALLIVLGVPFGALWEEVRFQWNLSAYERVVNLVETGDLQPDSNGYVRLPSAYAHLSANGLIRAATDGSALSLFFFRQGYPPTGYLYRSDGALPHNEFGGRWQTVMQKRPFWFYCARNP